MAKMENLTDKLKKAVVGLAVVGLSYYPLSSSYAQQGESYYLKKFKKENLCLPKKNHKIEKYKNLSLITYRKYNYCSSAISQKEKAFRHELAQESKDCLTNQAKRYNKHFHKEMRKR